VRVGSRLFGASAAGRDLLWRPAGVSNIGASDGGVYEGSRPLRNLAKGYAGVRAQPSTLILSRQNTPSSFSVLWIKVTYINVIV